MQLGLCGIKGNLRGQSAIPEIIFMQKHAKYYETFLQQRILKHLMRVFACKTLGAAFFHSNNQHLKTSNNKTIIKHSSHFSLKYQKFTQRDHASINSKILQLSVMIKCTPCVHQTGFSHPNTARFSTK